MLFGKVDIGDDDSLTFTDDKGAAIKVTDGIKGWLVADGREVSRTQYPDLFAAIRVEFGMGDGIDTFNLPDLRGEFIRGLDGGRGVDADRKFGSRQQDAFKNHTHSCGVLGQMVLAMSKPVPAT